MTPRLAAALILFALTLPVPAVDGVLAAWLFVAFVYGQTQTGSSQTAAQITSRSRNHSVKYVVGNIGASGV